MNLIDGITRSDLLIGFVGLLGAIVLLVAPGLEMGGVSLWFYLWPGLVASFYVPVRLTVLFVAIAAVVSWFLIGLNVTAYITEVAFGTALVLGFAAWRRTLGRSDLLVLASSVLLFAVFPLFWVLKHYWEGYGVEAALLHSTRYVLNCLISIVLAEVTVMVLAFSRLDFLEALREKLHLRPSMSSVVELIIGVAVTSSLMLTLSFIWFSWADTLDENLQAHADMRFIMQFSGIESVLAERGRAASLITTRFGDDSPVEDVFDIWIDTLTERDGELDGIFDRANFAVLYPGGAISHTAGVQTAPVARGFALAKARRGAGLVSFKLRFSDGLEYPVTVFLGPAGNAMAMLVFASDSDAARFVLGVGLASGQTRPSSGITLVEVDTSDTAAHYGLPSDTNIVFENPKGWLVWEQNDFRYDDQNYRAPLSNINESTRVTLQPSESLIERYEASLPGLDRWRVSTSYWRFFEDYGQVVIVSTGTALAFLSLLLWFSRFLVAALVKPLSDLTQIFSNWRQLRGGELGSGAALQAMDATDFSVLSDIRGLQTGFRSLAEDVMYGERRLSKIAANYDELLRSLPLGVLAVDGASRVQFLNDAMSEITHQRQDALARLKAHAANMLENNKTVDEWQLQWEDQPPKSLLLVVTARQDDRGKESGLWVIATDLTEQKQTNAQLVQASKLATLGEMSTGMAHELNQPLNVISLATSNLRFAIKKGRADSDNVLAKLERIDGAVHRAASIIDHMRAFGRLAGEGFVEIDLGEVVRGSCDLLAEQLKLANIDLINRVPEGGLTVKGNAIQLEQVLINQINNARDAIRENSDSGEVVVDSEVSGGRVLLRVTDTGGGIPAEVLPHIFEPFFTTKPVGKGTGLGGSISYGIVREMQGDIWAENVPGGAQITISLPLLHSQ